MNPSLLTVLFLPALLSSAVRAASKCAIASSANDTRVTPFCNKLYTTPISIGSSMRSISGSSFGVNELITLDESAKNTYNKMLRVLATFDCSKPYSYNTCDQCREYYKTWICLMTMPTCIDETSDTGKSISNNMDDYVTMKPCLTSCNKVLRACPYNLKFSCPEEASLFPHDYSTNTSTCDSGIVQN
jgi:hypothetical protein